MPKKRRAASPRSPESSGTSTGSAARRSAELTRLAIRRAARQLWAERPYEMVGVREIAARAGVTAALVNRYFGTKAELFRQSVTDAPDPANLDELRRRGGARDGIGLAVSTALQGPLGEIDSGTVTLDRAKATIQAEERFDSAMLLLRSTPSPAVRQHVRNQLIEPLSQQVRAELELRGIEHATARATLMLVLGLGLIAVGDMQKDVEPSPANADDANSHRQFQQLLARVLNEIATTSLS